jgi:hypothetical protein
MMTGVVWARFVFELLQWPVVEGGSGGGIEVEVVVVG